MWLGASGTKCEKIGRGRTLQSPKLHQQLSLLSTTLFSSSHLPCTESPLETQRAQLRWPLHQRYALSTFSSVFSVRCSPNFLTCDLELCGCCTHCSSHICYRETWCVLFSSRSNAMAHALPLPLFLSVVFWLTLSLATYTSQNSCIRGLIHSRVSYIWRIRRRKCRRDWPCPEYVQW